MISKTKFEQIVRTGENAGNQHTLLFQYFFSSIKDKFHHLSNSQARAVPCVNTFNSGKSTFLSCGKENTTYRELVQL